MGKVVGIYGDEASVYVRICNTIFRSYTQPHNRLVDKIYIKENFCRKMYAALLYFSSIFMMGDSFLFDSCTYTCVSISSQWTFLGLHDVCAMLEICG